MDVVNRSPEYLQAIIEMQTRISWLARQDSISLHDKVRRARAMAWGLWMQHDRDNAAKARRRLMAKGIKVAVEFPT